MSKQIIWNYFKGKGFTDCGVAGLMGNIKQESGFNPKNLQSTGNKKLGMTDDEYTTAVDCGTYSFDSYQKDGFGFGLAQWTWHSRKKALYNYAKKCGKSIGDLQMQLDFMYSELKGYPSVFKTLQTADTVRKASDAVLLQYERPADQSEVAQLKRAGYGEEIYNEFCMKHIEIELPVLRKGCKCDAVGTLQKLLKIDCDNSFGPITLEAVKNFQKAYSLEVDGIVGRKTWGKLLGAE